MQITNFSFSSVFFSSFLKNPVSELFYACSIGDLETVEKLVINGIVDVNIQDSNTLSTPLHISSSLGYVSIVKILLQNGANLKIRDRFGKTPFHLALINKQYEVLKLLKEYQWRDLYENEEDSYIVDLMLNY